MKKKIFRPTHNFTINMMRENLFLQDPENENLSNCPFCSGLYNRRNRCFFCIVSCWFNKIQPNVFRNEFHRSLIQWYAISHQPYGHNTNNSKEYQNSCNHSANSHTCSKYHYCTTNRTVRFVTQPSLSSQLSRSSHTSAGGRDGCRTRQNLTSHLFFNTELGDHTNWKLHNDR
jgi:hypothetical protein